MRIVSLIPSATEIICALGARESLVGVSHECDYPLGVEGLPSCCEPKIQVDRPSGEIDQSVKTIVEQGLSVYRVLGEILKDLRPDVIVTQTQCQVCAVDEPELKAAVGEWLDYEPSIVAHNANQIRDLWSDITDTAEALAIPKGGDDLIRALQIRLQNLANAVHGHLRDKPKPRVLNVEWMDPIMIAGHWMPELVEIAGGDPMLNEPAGASRTVTLEEIAAADPEVILVQPCGFSLEQTTKQLAELTDLPGWSDLGAVRTGKVYLCDGNQYFNRPGPRLIETTEIIAEILHPDVVKLGYEGKAYVAAPMV